MGFLGQSYNTDDLPKGNGFDPLPPGWYDAEIRKAEVKPTKAGDGKRLNIQFSINGPTHVDRVVFAALNIELPNSPAAEEIGRQQFGDLLRAIGLDAVEDSDELVGYSMRIRLKIRQQEGFDDANDVSGYKPAEESAPVAAPKSNGGAKPGPAAARPGQVAKPAARAASPAAKPAAGTVAKRPVPWGRKT